MWKWKRDNYFYKSMLNALHIFDKGNSLKDAFELGVRWS